MDLDTIINRENITNIIARDGIDKASAKSIRYALESQFDLQQDELKANKHSIAKIIEDIMSEYSSTSETSEKTKTFTCKTRSGTECPKNIKSTQSKTKLTVDEFLQSNKQLVIDVDGNTLTGNPRAFSSGNLGWYLTGKIELEVNGHKVWAQVGMNVTIPGSQVWSQK